MDKDEKKKQNPSAHSGSSGQASSGFKEAKGSDEIKGEEGVREVFDEEQNESEELQKLREETEACEAKYKRVLADYQNLEKRTRDERSEWIKAASRDLLLRLLPVLDTLSLANKHVDDQGLKVTLQQFLDILKAEGVTKIETVGKKFDPHLMEAIAVEEGGDTVIEEVRDGYLLYDKLLRPAQVRVGKKS